MTDKQRHSFAAKLPELPEMGNTLKVQKATAIAVRIAEMLQDPKKIKNYSHTFKSRL
jgi:hypothetical protein